MLTEAIWSLMLKYKINEIFTTIQCEGHFAGTPSIFIRFQGCDVGCGFCDTKFTWAEDEVDKLNLTEILLKDDSGNKSWAECSIENIIEHVMQLPNVKHLTLTGGEPCLQDLLPLITALEAIDKTVQIETSGTEIVNCTEKTWVTLSPKIEIGNMKPMLAQPILRANEIKYVVGAINHVKKLDEMLKKVPIKKDVPIYLQPMSQLSKATEVCIRLCIDRGWKLSLQTHKYIDIR